MWWYSQSLPLTCLVSFSVFLLMIPVSISFAKVVEQSLAEQEKRTKTKRAQKP
jgi:hypothetical protein